MRRAASAPDVLLTGVCGGIGRELAERYLRAGSRVALLGRDPDVLDVLVATAPDTAQAGDLAVMRRMLEINLLGVATTFQPFVAAMRERGRGCSWASPPSPGSAACPATAPTAPARAG